MQRRTALVLVKFEGFENPGMVDAFQQAELALCRLASRAAAEFRSLVGPRDRCARDASSSGR